MSIIQFIYLIRVHFWTYKYLTLATNLTIQNPSPKTNVHILYLFVLLETGSFIFHPIFYTYVRNTTKFVETSIMYHVYSIGLKKGVNVTL